MDLAGQLQWEVRPPPGDGPAGAETVSLEGDGTTLRALKQGGAFLRGTWDYGQYVEIAVAVWDHQP